jgi:putative acetyltransferase
MQISRTNSKNQGFIGLVKELDAYLTEVDGDEHPFYDQYNGIENLNHVVIVEIDGAAQSCGTIKTFDTDSLEVKRMYTSVEFRKMGMAKLVLTELEVWAKELGAKKLILETGINQKEAIQFYQKCGYIRTANFEPYEGVENSYCYGKSL